MALQWWWWSSRQQAMCWWKGVKGEGKGEGHWQAVHPRRKQATAASCHVAFVAQWKIRTASLGAPGRTSLSHHVWSESPTWSFFFSCSCHCPPVWKNESLWLAKNPHFFGKNWSPPAEFNHSFASCQFWHFFVYQGVRVFRQQHKTFHTNQNHNYWMSKNERHDQTRTQTVGLKMVPTAFGLFFFPPSKFNCWYLYAVSLIVSRNFFYRSCAQKSAC